MEAVVVGGDKHPMEALDKDMGREGSRASEAGSCCMA